MERVLAFLQISESRMITVNAKNAINHHHNIIVYVFGDARKRFLCWNNFFDHILSKMCDAPHSIHEESMSDNVHSTSLIFFITT